MLAALAAKLVWYGSTGMVVIGFAVLVAFAMALAGMRPYVLEGVVFASQTVLAGYAGLIQYWRATTIRGPRVRKVTWLNIALPTIAFVTFSLLFVLANPDLLSAFGRRLELVLNEWRQWLIEVAPDIGEIIFWLVAGWLSIGLIRPVMRRATDDAGTSPFAGEVGTKTEQSPLYQAFRNTLLTVIVLFAIYLVFELKTLWFREFPEGFYYSGYAHQGAAWLTLALALATAVLSIVFRGAVFRDPRVAKLRKLAWIWSFENLLLAIAVYHRMYIYIGFNGMTRMRVVGLFGMTAVVIGFGLVLWKIARRHDFVWLVRHHLWTVAIAVYLFALIPVDTFVVHYNVQRILEGDPAPSVQISVHPIGSEGVLLLLPLLECEDALIRGGVRAYWPTACWNRTNCLKSENSWGGRRIKLPTCAWQTAWNASKTNWQPTRISHSGRRRCSVFMTMRINGIKDVSSPIQIRKGCSRRTEAVPDSRSTRALPFFWKRWRTVMRVTMVCVLFLVPSVTRADHNDNLSQVSDLPRGQGLANAFAVDEAIETHADVIFADNFERGDFRQRWDSVRDTDNAVLSLEEPLGEDSRVGNKSLKVKAQLRKNTGGGVTKWFESSETIFIRFYVKFDPTCDYVHHFCTLR